MDTYDTQTYQVFQYTEILTLLQLERKSPDYLEDTHSVVVPTTTTGKAVCH